MGRLQEIARAKLAERTDGSLEALWGTFALESLVAGEIVDPPLAELRRLTAPDRAWNDVPPWPRDWLWFRAEALCRAHRLAIARDDRAWLTALQGCWDPPHEDMYATPLRALGEIGLGLAPEGARPSGWTEEERTMLVAQDVAVPDVCDDRAWFALSTGDVEAAGRALAEYETILDGYGAKWAADPEKGVVEALSYPELVLQVQRRALRALVDRAGVRAYGPSM